MNIRTFLPALLFLLMPLFLTAQDSSFERYCNNRYSFCINYPPQVFTEMHLASNGDGIILSNKKEDIIVRANGNYNVMEWSVEDELRSFLEVMDRRSAGSVKEVRRKIQSNSFEILLESNGVYLYKRVILSQNHFVSFSIELNRLGITSSYTLEQLLQMVSLDLGNS
jgi:hypothetical protein